MNIEVTYFGMLTDETGRQTELLQTSFSSVQELDEYIQSRYSGLKYKSYRIAVNNTFAKQHDTINEGDKVSFLPPFAGG